MGEPAFIRDVSLRDGLQMVRTQVPTAVKREWLDGLVADGVRRVEVTSFVPASVIPQFADAQDVAAHALAKGGAIASALVVNLKGAQRAFDAGFANVSYVVSASEAHSAANARRSSSAALDEFRLIAAERDLRRGERAITLECGIATSFGCSIQGKVDEARVVEIAERLVADGADTLLVADTVGYANPATVRGLFAGLRRAVGDVPVAAHFHDTRGLGLANVVAALDAGIRHFDASTAGLGGCPFAPGATGNINTEDCAFMLESMGFATGIDIEALVALRSRIEAWLPGERFHGAIARAGLPKV
ncbi:hydroxymethylglutaryl-CoA lyase [Bradyrhizobium sp. AS23.2]|uniref:hydroxymethylglutaryl-CoA lyase n=1 Tax=Bradyrhizobium sp. AS23.2 TaxID=1680155 RepID=UPI00093F4068|nr:hydroxymethylglutaryl-CoA lyase [Bradyrhizobium sp. AS23.2]OKO81102.1 3-hydroxy-3-methylglutaryl-CoA lyase [Bradyrhizobium sp. AS23.2]